MSDETIKEVLETLDIEPIAQTPAPETPPAASVVSAEPPVAAVPAVEPASPPAEPLTAPVEPPAGLPGEPAPPVVPAAVPAAVVPDPRDVELDAFRAQVMELSKRLAAVPQQPPPAAPFPAPVPSPIPAPVIPVADAGADIAFFKDEAEVDAALKDAGSFNKFLNNFLRQVEPIITQRAVTQALQAVPEVSMKVSTDQINMMSTIQAWYSSNPDLLPFREFCGVIAKEVAAKDPTMSMVKALDETEKEVRSRLRLVKPTTVAPVTPGGAPLGNPGFTPGGGAGPGAPGPVLDKVQQDILNTIG